MAGGGFAYGGAVINHYKSELRDKNPTELTEIAAEWSNLSFCGKIRAAFSLSDIEARSKAASSLLANPSEAERWQNNSM